MQSFVAYNTNDAIRYISSSGGVFYSLAKTILEENGVVCAAAYDQDFMVVHKFAETTDELMQFLGSKYLQSDLNTCFSQIKKYLDEGRKVLFAGTPCQVKAAQNIVGGGYQ